MFVLSPLMKAFSVCDHILSASEISSEWGLCHQTRQHFDGTYSKFPVKYFQHLGHISVQNTMQYTENKVSKNIKMVNKICIHGGKIHTQENERPTAPHKIDKSYS